MYIGDCTRDVSSSCGERRIAESNEELRRATCVPTAMPLFEEGGEVVETNEQSCDGHCIHGWDPLFWFSPSNHVLWADGILSNKNILPLVRNRGWLRLLSDLSVIPASRIFVPMRFPLLGHTNCRQSDAHPFGKPPVAEMPANFLPSVEGCPMLNWNSQKVAGPSMTVLALLRWRRIAASGLAIELWFNAICPWSIKPVFAEIISKPL